jgi:DNA-binding NarL/FixJ family response regulator
MSKKRPRRMTGGSGPSFLGPVAKADPAYWSSRLFKNTYTVKGQPHQTRNWCVKIQYLGIRRTLSLLADGRGQAALEACELYRSIRKQGWAAILHQARFGGAGPEFPSRSEDCLRAAYWAKRLVRREYGATAGSGAQRELSVHIEHEGTGYYFLLGVADQKLAASKALQIYRAVSSDGWETANETYSRELTVALHWFDSPLAWTYTTIHTHRECFRELKETTGSNRNPLRKIALVESDRGVGQALSNCINQMDGFSCAAVFATAAEALGTMAKVPVQLALVGSSVGDMAGAACLRELKLAVPSLSGLLYSVYEDSQELFKSTPGGATNYLLQRTDSSKLLEPIARVPASGDLSGEATSAAVWDYFKRIFSLPPAGFARVASNLTPREQEVIAGLSKGFADKDIAARLRISIHTVHEHVRNIFEKLGVHNRTEAVVKFLQK